MGINELIYSFVRDDYQRDNFDDFLKKVSFKYDIPSIHIAGTNGKSTVATILSNIYKENGYKTGLFLSSSVNKDISEMIKINNEPVSLVKIEKIFNDHQKLFKKYDLSHFEIAVIIALTIFKEEKVDLAVIECGIGGEYDATNVFTPILSIITNVAIEHTDILGVSLSEIALHKAGIIKDNVPLLIGKIEGDALDVIVNACRNKGSNVIRIGDEHKVRSTQNGLLFDYKTYTDLEINNKSLTNVKNACLAIDAIDLLNDKFPTNVEDIRKGLLLPLPKARFEFVNGFIFDSAHNPAAIVALRHDIDRLMLGGVNVIFASLTDKNITVMLPEIALVGKLYLSTFDSPKARTESDYFLYLNEYEFVEDYLNKIKEIKESNPDSIIVITGSTAFATKVRDIILQNK